MKKIKKVFYVERPAPANSENKTIREPWEKTTVVGQPLPRIDAYERVSGSAVYTLDMKLPDMLYGAILRCPHAHAKIKKIDTTAAAKMPGVRAILTDTDSKIPWHETEKGANSRLFDSHCKHQGEEVAAVAAENQYQAYDAIRAIQVEYEELTSVSDLEEAVAAGNLLPDPYVVERGDITAGFAQADVVVDETYRTPCEIHTPMEVHGSIARWDGNRLTVWDSTQGVFEIRASLARVFQMPMSSVRVIGHYMGGGFGSKLELGKYTVIAALLAQKTGQPVKMILSREETFLCVGNRPANILHLKAGVKKDGTLTALQMDLLGTPGAYPDDATSGFLVGDLYLCPNVRVEERSVLINAGKQRPFRAPGFPQCAWALEQTLDALAEKIGMDPVELRLKNIPAYSQLRENKPYTSTGLKDCLVEGARVFGWKERREQKSTGHIRRGVGVAAGSWGYPGRPPATSIVKLFADGSVSLNTGASDIGTGTKTVLAMVVAEELGIALKDIQIEHADTSTTQFAPSSGGSQTIVVNAPAVREASIEVREKLLSIAAAEMNCEPSDLHLKEGRVVRANGESLPFADIKGLQAQQVLVGVGHRHPNVTDKVPIPFAAQFAEVEVNLATGEITVLRLLGAHDSGRVMNPLTYENQVFGGMTMGLGFGMLENRVLDQRQTDRMTNANWHDYKIPTAMDVPKEMICVPIDLHDRECNSTGAKGLGEPATIPTAPAIANAVYHATGIRMKEAPMTPMQMLQLISLHHGKKTDQGGEA